MKGAVRIILLNESAFKPGDLLPKEIIDSLKLEGLILLPNRDTQLESSHIETEAPKVLAHNLTIGYDDKSTYEVGTTRIIW